MKKFLVVVIVTVTFCFSLGNLANAQEKWSWLAEAAKPYRGITIHCIHESSQPSMIMREFIPEFEEITGIKVEMENVPWTDVYKKTSLDLAAGTGVYDEMYVEGEIRAAFAEAGYLEPLDKYIANPKITDPNLDLADFIPECIWATGVYPPDTRNEFRSTKGTLYALPFDNAAMLLFYRKDLFEDPIEKAKFKAKYGYDLGVPVTWDQYRDIAEFFTRDTDGDGRIDLYGCVAQMKRHDAMTCESMNYWYAFGGRIFDDAMNVVLDSLKTVEGLKFYISLKKFMPPGVTTYTWDEAGIALAQGLVVMGPEWNEFAPVMDDPAKSKVVGKIGYAVTPMKIRHTPVGGGAGAAISKFSKNKEAAWLFIQWATSKEIQKRIVLKGCPTPVRLSAFIDPEITKEATNPRSPLRQLPAMLKASGIRAWRPRVPEWPQINEIIFTNWSDAIAGRKTPEEAISTAAREIRQVMGK